MVARLASSTFSAGPQDELAAADIYTQTKTTVINSVREDNLSSLAQKAGDALRGGKSMLNTALGLVRQASALKNVLSSGDILSRVGAAVGPVSGLLRTVAPGTSSTILSYAGQSFSGASQIKMTMGNVTSVLNNGASFSDVQALSATFGKITGNPSSSSLADISGISSTLASVSKYASGLGLKNTYEQFVSYPGITSLNASDKQICLADFNARVTPDIIANSDVYSLRSMAQTSSLGLKIQTPSLLDNFASGFKMPTGSTTRDYKDSYSVTNEAFTAVDPGWSRGTRIQPPDPSNPSVPVKDIISSITTVQKASADFQRMFNVGARVSDDPIKKLQLLANAFPKKSFTDSLSAAFPRTVVNQPAQRAQPQTTDPRVVQGGYDSLGATDSGPVRVIEVDWTPLYAQIAKSKRLAQEQTAVAGVQY